MLDLLRRVEEIHELEHDEHFRVRVIFPVAVGLEGENQNEIALW